jgi:hypothetical protein
MGLLHGGIGVAVGGLGIMGLYHAVHNFKSHPTNVNGLNKTVALTPSPTPYPTPVRLARYIPRMD